jgi:hypothetical protein
VTFVASTGDFGAADPEYPALSPNVVAVGGTSLYLNSDNSYNSETGWGNYSSEMGTFIGSGGAISQYETEPAFQQGVQSTGFRTTPDVSFLADPSTGVWIADPYNLSSDNPWIEVGGTSLAAPAWSGLIAIADQGRTDAGEATLGTNGPTEAQTALYSIPASDYSEVTSGTNGYSAGAGYNLVTGLGTPVADLLIPDLVGYDGAPMDAASAGEQPIISSGLTLDTDVLISSGNSGNAESNGLANFDALVSLPIFGRDTHVAASQFSLKAGGSAVAGTHPAPVNEVTDQPDHLTVLSTASASDLPAILVSGGIITNVPQGFSSTVESFDSIVHGKTSASTQPSYSVPSQGTHGTGNTAEPSSSTSNTESNESPTISDDDLVASLLDGIWMGGETSFPTRA